MRLKVLILPFFIILILILGIGYIKPDFDSMQTKKAEIAANEVRMANIESVIANIGSLNGSLDTEREAEQLMYRYLPYTLDQEQMIDTFNFLANQSGLIVEKMELKQPTEAAPEAPLIDDPAAETLVAGGESPDVSGASAVPAPPVTVKTFVLKGGVTGSYENIKAFFDKISRIERFQKVNFFSMEAAEKTDSPDTENGPKGLVGTFEASFGYLPSRSIASAIGLPVFLQSKFDFSNIEKLSDQLTNPLPALQKGETGKPNPFL